MTRCPHEHPLPNRIQARRDAPHRLPSRGRYPSAVIPDLLAFLAWSTRNGDIEYESANFLFWSKRALNERQQQLGFGICSNDELHGDIAYYYVVEHAGAGTVVRTYAVEYDDGPRIGCLVQEVAVPQPLFSFSSSTQPMELSRVQLNGKWYFRDDRLREFRRCDNPQERITFDEMLDDAA